MIQRKVHYTHIGSHGTEGDEVFSGTDIYDPNKWILPGMLVGGTRTATKSKIKNKVPCFGSGRGISKGSNEVSFSRLLWSWCTGGPPTTGRRKSLRSLLRPWLAVSQIKTTNYDNIIGSSCSELGLPVCSWGWHWPFFPLQMSSAVQSFRT